MTAFAMLLDDDDEALRRTAQRLDAEHGARYDDEETRAFDTLSVLIMAVLMVVSSAVAAAMVLVVYFSIWK
jgi:cell division protein FtsX